MGKLISSRKLSDTMSMSLCTDGYWLYDEVAGMNLSMRASNESDAFVEALTYYQERLEFVENKHDLLNKKVESFLCQFTSEED